MAVYISNDEFSVFPSLRSVDTDGLLLIGPTPTPARVLQAYRQGIFPWYDDEEFPLWWTPDPRFVIYPPELHISKSMKKLLRHPPFQFSINKAFAQVIQQCAATLRKGQDGTWLTPVMIDAFQQLHTMGYGYSAEAWEGETLVGGVYGLKTGDVFFAESMFSHRTNASKYALINLINWLQMQGVKLVDAQVHSDHVESMGGRLISRNLYLQQLAQFIP